MKLFTASLTLLPLAVGCAATSNPSNPQPAAYGSQDSTTQNYPPNYPPPMTSLPPAPPPEVRYLPPPQAPEPAPTRTAAQGWFGINYVDTRDVDTDNSNISDIDVESTNMPVFGGAFMKPIGGNKLQFGVEGGLSMGWQGNVSAVAIGGGGAAIAADTDVFLFDLFAGPYASLRLNPKSRLYFAAGFILEWAAFDYDIGVNDISEDGFGDGVYARTGFEIQTGPGTWVGLGFRYAETSLDPGGAIDEVDLQQTQYLLTVTHSM